MQGPRGQVYFYLGATYFVLKAYSRLYIQEIKTGRAWGLYAVPATEP